MASTNQNPEFLSLRDYVAAQALIALIRSNHSTYLTTAKEAYKFADAMIEASSYAPETLKKPS